MADLAQCILCTVIFGGRGVHAFRLESRLAQLLCGVVLSIFACILSAF